ncbi:TIGR02710 family CRISPR-associated protein [Thiorhodococcus mannitoliphagus]|uniref:TIGR02710 family CRISPR-associated protein n=1 Tax=Thiorhodococcus mannitoliphagus TaxID=329406 RepID=A0A6P1DWA6_9GAMM|nr:TIGR02710 family CRISPR-associated CARF protein [Thiorhodococcus mannitoliphagus]NEX22438.1 TIGR02710 family CRISPR-associated protein [Thiorhodococcus mannitoliphagus]
MPKPILICTVGGSPEPILTAIRDLEPAFVLFFCTGEDPATGKPGSQLMIRGKGTPVKIGRDAYARYLPNIPTHLGLSEDAYEDTLVPSDDLDHAVAIMTQAIADLRKGFPEAACIADYTGGTKTMTAALVMASLDAEGVELQLITGARSDLVRVRDGSEGPLAVSAEGIRLRRAMTPLLDAWQRFGYGEAADGLARLRKPRDPNLRAELQIAKDLSQAFDAWDRFDHAAALAQLQVYSPRLGRACGAYLAALKVMTAEGDAKRWPARLWDLWLNAQRRADQCRYDDAVARLYRLLEWTAQWLLSTHEIDTSNLDPAQIPESLNISPGPDGKYQAGLRNAWALAAHHLGGDVATFWETESSHLLDLLKIRNYSILAHGDQPIASGDWETFRAWVQSALIPLLDAQSKAVGLKTLAPQLPQRPLWRNHQS